MPQGGATGTGGAGAAAGNAGAGGLVIGPTPPFSIPPAPASGTLTPCDSMATPEVLALLANGRALVTQRIWDQRLVRLWTVATNALETLFATSNPFSETDEPLSVSDDGRYVFELLGDLRSGEGTGVRVFDVVARQFFPAAPVPVAAVAVSSNGRALLDRDLKRYTSEGQPDFDFAPLLVAAFPAVRDWSFAARPALSPTGSAVAIRVRVSADSGLSVVVARQDGRLVTLADSPPLRDCSRAALSFSPDERFVLARACQALRVWDLDSGTAVMSADTGVIAAAFTRTGSRLVTADASGVIERDLDGANPVAWAVDGQYPFVLGPDALLGHRHDGALVVLARGQVVGTWRHPRRTWERAVAVTDDASFTIGDAWDAEPITVEMPGAVQMLARFAANRAGPTATLATNERQSEWDGQIAPSPDGRRLAVAFPDSVRIVDSGTLAVITSLGTEAGSLAWSPDGRYLAATPSIHYRDPARVPYRPAKAVALWEARSGALVASFPTAIYPRGIAFDETGGTIRGWGSDLTVSGPSDFGVTSFRPEGESASFKIDVPTGMVTPTLDAPFVGSARDLVAEEGGLFRISTGTALATFGNLPARRAVFSGDLSLVFLTNDGESRLFAVEDGRQVAEAPPLGFFRTPLALSHDGRRLVVDQTILCLGP